MSQPREFEHGPEDDRDQLVRYLLGLLPSDRAERLDEAAITDDDIAARLRVVENDLVDAYVRGDLTGETLERFESHYLLSPRRRRMVTFARGFVRAVDGAAPASASEPESQVASSTRPADADPHVAAAPRERSAGRGRFSPMLLALAAVLVAACGVLIVQAARLRTGLEAARSQTAALEQRTRSLEQQLADQKASKDAAVKELERARTASAAPVGAAKTAASGVEMLPAALVLLPQTRAIGPIPTLTLPAHTERVPIELRLESNDFVQYEGGLKDPATSQVIWRSGWLFATWAPSRRLVRLAVPANLLKPQHYSLDLSGRDASGHVEVVGSYAFQVAPQ